MLKGCKGMLSFKSIQGKITLEYLAQLDVMKMYCLKFQVDSKNQNIAIPRVYLESDISLLDSVDTRSDCTFCAV